MRRGFTFGALALAMFAWADNVEKPEQPVGLVLAPGGSQLLRANTETPLAARSGDLLFSGDGLRTGSSAASFLFCPAKAIETLAASGEVRFETAQAKVKSGKLSQQTVNGCALPQTLRVSIASQQHYGVTMTRGANAAEIPPIPLNQLPADVIAELTAVNARDPQDPQTRVAAATIFENHHLLANALEQYTKLRETWPDAVWVKSKVFEIGETLSEQAAAKPVTSTGNTYALLIGISKYKRPELALQFAEADASVVEITRKPARWRTQFAKRHALMDEQATTAAVRNAFRIC